MDAVRNVVDMAATVGRLTDDQQLMLALAKAFEVESEKARKAGAPVAVWLSLEAAGGSLRRVIAHSL